MAVGDWSETTLCTDANVTARYSRASSLLKSGETIEDYRAIAKEEIGKELDFRLREQRWNITETDAADLKDLISNPEVFKDAAVAFTLLRLFEKNIFEEADFHTVQRDIYRQEYKETFNRGFGLMEFDKDASGDIDDDEVAAGPGSTRFFRV